MFVDTIIVCTATAFVILIAGPDAWMAEGADPSTLTTLAISRQLGGWTVLPMAILIFVLAYSSIIAAYVYTDVNMDYLTGGRRWASWTVRVVSVASATAGAVLSLDVVWNAVDIAMAIMTLTNLVACCGCSAGAWAHCGTMRLSAPMVWPNQSSTVVATRICPQTCPVMSGPDLASMPFERACDEHRPTAHPTKENLMIPTIPRTLPRTLPITRPAAATGAER